MHRRPSHVSHVSPDLSGIRSPVGHSDEYSSGEDSQTGTHQNGSGPRKRLRPLSVSCELCKSRKVKCDRGQPACGWCTRNGAHCEYKEKKKPGLRAGYGRGLEQRLDRLEEILQAHSRILDSGIFSQIHESSLGSSQTSPQDPQSFLPNDGPAPHHSQADVALFLQKPGSFSSTSQNINYNGTSLPPTPSLQALHSDIFQRTSSTNSMPQTQNTHLQNRGQSIPEYYNHNQPPLDSATVNITETGPSFEAEHDLPPYDLLYALVDLYFKHINTWCPILHRRSTLDSLFGPSILEEADRILLHAIVATTLRFSTDKRLTEERRRHYHDVSKQKVLLYGMENSSVKAIQAMVILALDLVGTSNGPPGWNLLALITRSVVQLGLSVETNSFSVLPNYPSIYSLRAMVLPESKTWVEEESRRRLFWMIYLLDRYATIATAFEFALSEKEIDRKLPCRDDLWNKNVPVETRWFRTPDRSSNNNSNNDESTPHAYEDKPENLGAFSYYVEILGHLSKIHQFLKQPVDISALSDVSHWQATYRNLDNALTSWKFALPSEYGNMARLFHPSSSQNSKPLSCPWVMLHATYHTAVIRLHSSAAYPTTRSPIFTASYSASQRCHGAVENIAALTEYVISHSLLPTLGPPFAFTLWVAARVLLVHGSTVEHQISPQIQLFVDTLAEMGQFWAVAARYTSILTRVLDEHRESVEDGRAAMGGEDRVMPSSVRILADMRRSAYDLDFLISRAPRHGKAGVRLSSGGGAGIVTPGGEGTGEASGITSAGGGRTPAANELEYLDVFDFFNVPRLPVNFMGGIGVCGMGGEGEGMENIGGGDENGGDENGGDENGGDGRGPVLGNGGGHGNGVGNGEFNITNYMVDANSDWLFKN